MDQITFLILNIFMKSLQFPVQGISRYFGWFGGSIDNGRSSDEFKDLSGIDEIVARTEETDVVKVDIPEESDKVINKLREEAYEGNTDSIMKLGFAYLKGDLGRDVDLNQAKLWFKQAGELHQDPRGFLEAARIEKSMKDTSGFIQSLEKASALDSHEAQFELGSIYFWGHSVEKNPSLANSLFSKSFNGLNTRSMVNMGAILFYGIAVKRDKAKGRKMTRDAADKNDPVGILNLGVLLRMDGKDRESTVLIDKACSVLPENITRMAQQVNGMVMYRGSFEDSKDPFAIVCRHSKYQQLKNNANSDSTVVVDVDYRKRD